MINYNVGDFVWYVHNAKDLYPARVTAKEKNGIYVLEICTNKRKNIQAELDVVKVKINQIKPRNLVA